MAGCCLPLLARFFPLGFFRPDGSHQPAAGQFPAAAAVVERLVSGNPAHDSTSHLFYVVRHPSTPPGLEERRRDSEVVLRQPILRCIVAKYQQNLSAVHHIARSDAHFLYAAGCFREQAIFHFHCLENQQRIPRGYAITRPYQNLGNLSWHGRGNFRHNDVADIRSARRQIGFETVGLSADPDPSLPSLLRDVEVMAFSVDQKNELSQPSRDDFDSVFLAIDSDTEPTCLSMYLSGDSFVSMA